MQIKGNAVASFAVSATFRRMLHFSHLFFFCLPCKQISRQITENPTGLDLFLFFFSNIFFVFSRLRLCKFADHHLLNPMLSRNVRQSFFADQLFASVEDAWVAPIGLRQVDQVDRSCVKCASLSTRKVFALRWQVHLANHSFDTNLTMMFTKSANERLTLDMSTFALVQ